jgi:glutaminase
MNERARCRTARLRAVHELAKVVPDSSVSPLPLRTGKFLVGDVGDGSRSIDLKALTYCMALELCGVEVPPVGSSRAATLQRHQFNPVTRRPYNPMVNAGAIAISGLLRTGWRDGHSAPFSTILEGGGVRCA